MKARPRMGPLKVASNLKALLPLPSSWFELRRLIVESIERTIGQPLAPTEDHDASVYVADFDPGHGMSAGHVHLAWWLKTGIPIVIDRFEGVLAEPASG